MTVLKAPEPDMRFKSLATQWLQDDGLKKRWAPTHTQAIEGRLQKNIYPWLGERHVDEISDADILSCLYRLEARNAIETAHRVLSYCHQICRYAEVLGAQEKPLGHLQAELMPKNTKRTQPATEVEDIARMLWAIDGYRGSPVTQYALKLAPLVLLRPGELRKARWQDIDFSKRIWNTPMDNPLKATRKIGAPKSSPTPLSNQAIHILKQLKKITGHNDYIFPGTRDSSRPMSDNTVNSAFRTLGFNGEEITGLGFRVMASQICVKELKIPVTVVEHQITHLDTRNHRKSPDRQAFLPERAEMMQQWANYIDGLKQQMLNVNAIGV